MADETIEQIKKKIESIKQCNEIEDADKAWETSHVRTAAICGIIYLVATVLFYSIGVNRFWLIAFVPALGCYLFTWSLPIIKKWWLDSRQ